jgi:hypothetical protein
VPWGLLAAPDSVRGTDPHQLPLRGREEEEVSNLTRTIKWRAAAPVAKAGVAFGTVVALITVVGAPFKWAMMIVQELV